MKNKVIAIVMLIAFLLCSCGKSKSEDTSSKSKDETVAFATKIDLFNALEDLIKKIPDKKYEESYDALNELFKLSNKSGFVSDPKDEEATLYITNLNELTAHLSNESKIQKGKKVDFDYEKSQLSILASIASEGGQQQGQSGGGESGGGESGGGGSSGEGGSSESSSGMESESSGDSSGESGQESGGSEGQQKQQIIIPEEELLKKYPELILTAKDMNIYDLSIDLLGYVTKVTLESKPDDEKAMTNREKYLLYKMSSLSKLEKSDEAKDYLLEAQSNWNKLYIKVPEKNQQDAITLNALLKNIESSLGMKNAVAVEIQSKIAIELIDTLSSKMKSE